MRFAHFAAVAMLLAPIASNAQTAAAPDSSIQAPATTAAPIQKPKPKATQAQRFQARFNTANTTHDGHLTLDQARVNKWHAVVNNFSKVDTDGKGFVTAEQLRSYYVAQRAAKAKTKMNVSPSGDPSAVPSRS